MTDIFTYSSDVVDRLIERHPELATHLGVPGHDDRWSDLSPEAHQDNRRFWQEVADTARTADRPDRAALVAAEVLAADAEREVRSVDAGLHLTDLNNIASPWQQVRDLFDAMPDDSVDAWRNIVARLATIDQPLAGYRACLALGLDEGRTVARRQVVDAVAQGRVAAGDESGLDVLRRRFDAAVEVDASIADVGDDLDAAIGTAKSAIADMTDWLESTYLPHAREEDGVGREQYVRSAERFLGTEIDPEELYRWGWGEIASLRARLVELAAAIDPERSVAEVAELLQTDPDRAAGSVDEFLSIMQERQERALESLAGSHFDVPDPVMTVEVKAAPPGGALAPYYMPPSEDFSRPGCVWYPVSHKDVFPLYDEVTTAYHEGFPGHHLQVGWQVAMGDALSRYHRLLCWYPGSGEGWALYAETLMGELGFLEEPDYEFGLVTSQLFRSCRIVIDIGVHCGFAIPDDVDFHPGASWTFDLATEMLRDLAFVDEAMADSEVIRYFGWPGQAISYKVGERAILELRERHRAASDFDQKSFHARMLSVGSIGLDLLEELMSDDGDVAAVTSPAG